MDWLLWAYGEQVARQRSRATPWELDFLRGMHQGPALQQLAIALGAASGQPVRLMSIWLDKQTWASWEGPIGGSSGRRELADLAVIVRRPNNGVVHRWMWLLQAKRTVGALAPYPSGGLKLRSTDWELDLLHRMPRFTLTSCTRPFDLQQDFRPTKPGGAPWHVDAAVPWTFLDLDSDPKSAASAPSRFSTTPINARWVGEPLSTASWAFDLGYSEPRLASYFGCLAALLKGTSAGWYPTASGTQPNFLPGAPVANSHPEWARLYGALVKSAVTSTTGHARSSGNAAGAVLQKSDFSMMQVSRAMAAMTPEFERHWPYQWLESSRRFGLGDIRNPFPRLAAWVALSSSLNTIQKEAYRSFDEQCYGDGADGTLEDFDARSEGDPGGGKGDQIPAEYEFEGPGGMGVLIIDAVGEMSPHG